MKRLVMILIMLFAATAARAWNVYEFKLSTYPDGKPFYAKTNDQDVIDQCESQLAKAEDKRRLFINGEIDYGNGGYNVGWSWHFVPNKWHLTEAAVEVCDGTPQMVEDDLDYWINTLGQFCPWTAIVTRQVGESEVDRPENKPSIYPNPCADIVRVVLPESIAGKCYYRIYDNIGSRLAGGEIHTDSGIESINISALRSGVYYLIISVGGNNTHHRLIKR